MDMAIYGAKSIALGVERAVKLLYPDCRIACFLVESLENNPACLDGLQVREIREFSSAYGGGDKKGIHILVGTPEDKHPEIVAVLEQYGYHNYTCMDAGREARLMEKYYSVLGGFPSLRGLQAGKKAVSLQVFMAVSGKDKKLCRPYRLPVWVKPLQVGAALGGVRLPGLSDDTGDNISGKNGNYCELTALYWMWKNVLGEEGAAGQYYGLYQYRRGLDITQEDLGRLAEADVVLQYPTLHEPDMGEHHARYIAESDWQAMLCALRELHPEYAEAFGRILGQPYFYNYNLIVAKREILADYCAWLFPVLARAEELSVPQGTQRSDRYIGYIGESLMTLYFMYHREHMKIYHTGRYMLV